MKLDPTTLPLIRAGTTEPSLNFTVCPKGPEIAPVVSARTKLADSAPMVALTATFEPTAKPSALNSRRFSNCPLAGTSLAPLSSPKSPPKRPLDSTFPERRHAFAL
jgi:hypothetical protein